jgi:hypothetical protein
LKCALDASAIATFVNPPEHCARHDDEKHLKNADGFHRLLDGLTKLGDSYAIEFRAAGRLVR